MVKYYHIINDKTAICVLELLKENPLSKEELSLLKDSQINRLFL